MAEATQKSLRSLSNETLLTSKSDHAMLRNTILLLCFFLTQLTQAQTTTQNNAAAHARDLKRFGKTPAAFVSQALNTHQLIVFDDAMHQAEEPFHFYIQLLLDSNIRKKINIVFIEIFGINAQPDIERYLNAAVKDSTLLSPVFQNDFTGYGFRYQTYLDLLSTLWDINHQLPQSDRIRVIGVDQPVYWEAIHTSEDYSVFQESLIARDHFMYRKIADEMQEFSGELKAIFLTNTRHAYKGIRNAKGQFYENVTTLLSQRYPRKVFSIRIHNATLLVKKQKSAASGGTTEGLDRFIYEWGMIDNGAWDKAFAANRNSPVGIPLSNSVFGSAPYVGNHMLNVYPGQKMLNAYDGLVFLAPISQLHRSAKFDFIYTYQFKQEMKRRISILYDNDTNALLQKEKLSTLEEYIDKLTKPVAAQLENILQQK
jgi:hypothetical protein